MYRSMHLTVGTAFFIKNRWLLEKVGDKANFIENSLSLPSSIGYIN